MTPPASDVHICRPASFLTSSLEGKTFPHLWHGRSCTVRSMSLRRGLHRLQQTSDSEGTMRTCLHGCPVICRAAPLIEVAARRLRSRQRVSHLQLLHAAARPRGPECWCTARKAQGAFCLTLETLLTGSHQVQVPSFAQGHGTVSKPSDGPWIRSWWPTWQARKLPGLPQALSAQPL